MEIKGGKGGCDKALLTTQGKQVDGELPTAEDQTKSCERPSHAHLLRVQKREPPPLLPVLFTLACRGSQGLGGSSFVQRLWITVDINVLIVRVFIVPLNLKLSL